MQEWLPHLGALGTLDAIGALDALGTLGVLGTIVTLGALGTQYKGVNYDGLVDVVINGSL